MWSFSFEKVTPIRAGPPAGRTAQEHMPSWGGTHAHMCMCVHMHDANPRARTAHAADLVVDRSLHAHSDCQPGTVGGARSAPRKTTLFMLSWTDMLNGNWVDGRSIR